MEIIVTLPYKITEKIEDIIAKAKYSGIKSFRLNVSKASKQYDIKAMIECVDTIRKYCSNANIILDLPYPQRRPRLYMDNYSCERRIGDIIEYYTNKEGIANSINVCDCRDFFVINKNYFYGDGEGILKVVDVNQEYVVFKCENDFTQYSGKAITSEILIKDEAIVLLYNKLIARIAPTQLWFSYVENTDEIDILVKESNIEVFVKIETVRGIENIEKLLKYNLVIARGDLGLNIEYYQMKNNQEYIVKKAKEYNKKVYIATGILTSMSRKVIPDRAEMIDLCNIFELNVDGIMLNVASSTSPYFMHLIQYVKNGFEYYEAKKLSE